MFKINFVYRQPRPSNFSIEHIFKLLHAKINSSYNVEEQVVPFFGGTPIVIIKNIFHIKKNDGLFHITGDVHYLALRTGCNTVLTVHDVKSIIKGSFFKQIYLKIFWFWLPALIVKKITVISEFSKEELVRIIPYASRKIHVIHNPINGSFQFSSLNFNKSNPCILCVGTKPNKNLERIFEAISGLTCSLHIIGQLTDGQREQLANCGINFRNTAQLSQEEVVAAYIQCDLLCFASTYEGFGMPIIEAQAVGRPVITSNLGAMKEVAGDSACLVDPFDKASIRAGLEQLILNADYRDQLIAKGFVNVKRFSLEHIVKQYMNLYQELLSQKR